MRPRRSGDTPAAASAITPSRKRSAKTLNDAIPRNWRANCAPNSSVAHNAVPSAWFAHHTLSGQRYWKPKPSKVARPTPNDAT
ncbi:hypothetical protein D3C83_56340 [compost metagenome]